MGAYILFALMWVVIIFAWTIPTMRRGLVHEFYESLGLGGFFSLLILGVDGMLVDYNILPLKVIGFLLYVPAGFFVVSAFASLKKRGKPKEGWEETTEMIEGSVFGLVRHPLYLGTAIFTVAFMLIFQSLASIVLGIVCILCFWLASKREDDYNIEKFGDSYEEYMKRVPMWNFFKRLKR